MEFAGEVCGRFEINVPSLIESVRISPASVRGTQGYCIGQRVLYSALDAH